jgi:hypothetical protein
MEVREVLVAALKAVDDAKLPPELQAVAFGKAVDLVAARAGSPVPQMQPVRRDHAAGEQPAAESSPLDRIAARLKLEVEVVQDVYHYDDERGLQIVVSPRKLEKQLGGAAKQLALLVAAGRQASGLEDGEWTDIAEIREVCQEYKKLDPSNFAAHIKSMKDEFNLRGSGQKRLVKVTRPGWDAARELVEKLAGAEG